MTMEKRGFVYTLEALVVVGVVFLTMAYVFRYAPPAPQSDITIMKRAGIDALEYLEQRGELRRYISELNEAQIESSLAGILPPAIKFETEICRDYCNTFGVPTRQTVAVVDYYVSAYRDSYEGQRIRLWLWR